ncbi:hypothetical protein BGZ63DRAFT_400423 [Mariannaea sp. PMI_226]|nr:hypothetical protein BGZ63DRAFT_400423 [Mariannaea sp. PMI_226]
MADDDDYHTMERDDADADADDGQPVILVHTPGEARGTPNPKGPMSSRPKAQRGSSYSSRQVNHVPAGLALDEIPSYGLAWTPWISDGSWSRSIAGEAAKKQPGCGAAGTRFLNGQISFFVSFPQRMITHQLARRKLINLSVVSAMAGCSSGRATHEMGTCDDGVPNLPLAT